MAKKTSNSKYVSSALAGVSKMHVLLGLVFSAQIMIYDAWKLVTPDTVLKRWLVVAAVLISAVLCWYIATVGSSKTLLHNALWALIVVDIAAFSYLVYLQRGMASKAVLLYAIPVITSAVLLKRSAVYLTAAFCAVAYVLSAVAYFVLNFNEGYKIELYGEITFYSAVIFIIAGLVSVFIKSTKLPSV